MTRCIAHPFESFSDGRVLRTHGATMVEDIDPNRVPPVSTLALVGEQLGAAL